ncbi:MAG: hypothetical protein JWQ49_5196 [Edaphobacter sp.]|nr:hypothetical protein [Edaphobacter sp.]
MEEGLYIARDSGGSSHRGAVHLLAEGPKFRELLERIETMQLEWDVTTREYALRVLKHYVEAEKALAQKEREGLVKKLVVVALLASAFTAALFLFFQPKRTVRPEVVPATAPATPTVPRAVRRSTNHSTRNSYFGWPSTGLPTEIVSALQTPDLTPPGPGVRPVTLSPGRIQMVEVTEPCTGSAGCGWDLTDVTTHRTLIGEELGSLHRTPLATNGYSNLLVAGKQVLLLYHYDGTAYKQVTCYSSDRFDLPATQVACEGH